MWGAAPCSTLPTADENAVTESAVTTVSSSLFQSATVLTKNEFLYWSILLSGIFKPQEFRISCLITAKIRNKKDGDSPPPPPPYILVFELCAYECPSTFDLVFHYQRERFLSADVGKAFILTTQRSQIAFFSVHFYCGFLTAVACFIFCQAIYLSGSASSASFAICNP